MTYTFELKTPDGDDAGTLLTSERNWEPGDTVIAQGNRRYRVTAVIPLPTIGEFVDGATCGLLEVEPAKRIYRRRCVPYGVPSATQVDRYAQARAATQP